MKRTKATLTIGQCQPEHFNKVISAFFSKERNQTSKEDFKHIPTLEERKKPEHTIVPLDCMHIMPSEIEDVETIVKYVFDHMPTQDKKYYKLFKYSTKWNCAVYEFDFGQFNLYFVKDPNSFNQWLSCNIKVLTHINLYAHDYTKEQVQAMLETLKAVRLGLNSCYFD